MRCGMRTESNSLRGEGQLRETDCDLPGPLSGLSMFARTKSSAEIRYALAFLGSGIALIFWWLLGPSVFGTLYYITLWPVVIISAWHLGFGPSIVTVLSGSLGVWYFLLHHSFVPR